MRTVRQLAQTVLSLQHPGEKIAAIRSARLQLAASAVPVGAAVPLAVAPAPCADVVPLKDIAKHHSAGMEVRLLHAIAHIEYNAMNLYWDMLGRFDVDAPHSFYTDFAAVACDEADHFEALDARLQSLHSGYGQLPVHNALSAGLEATSSSVVDRIVLTSLVHEARALDSHHRLTAKFNSCSGDKRSAKLLQWIVECEVEHVRVGLKWFRHFAGDRSKEVFQSSVQRLVGPLRPPFNVESRTAAGFPPDWYQTVTKSGVYILDQRGKNLIHRAFRRDAPAASVVSERFTRIVLESDEPSEKPVFQHHDITYMWIRANNLFLIGTSALNANVLMALSFLYRLSEILTEYFSSLEEESIRDNFVVIYELLDEMMDNGYPQITESRVLKEFIRTEATRLETVSLPASVADPVSWRPRGIVHRKNEAYLDVTERLSVLVGFDGVLISSDIQGTLKMRSLLSGMPEVRLGINEKVMMEAAGRSVKTTAIELEDIRFHQCVRLAKFYSDRMITFVPPDGEFELMTYRLATRVKPLIVAECVFETLTQARVTYVVKVKAQYRASLTAKDVEVRVPTPADAQTPSFKTAMGTLKYCPGDNHFQWSLNHFAGGREYVAKASFSLPSVRSEVQDDFRRAPIDVCFAIPYFAVSGLRVRYLRVEESSGYTASPWVQYVTQNGTCQFRLV